MRVFLVLLLLAGRAEPRWLRLEAGPFAIVTDAGEKTARQSLEQLERARRAFSFLLPQSSQSPLPVTVYALASETLFATVQPGPGARGFYQSAPLRDYIVVRVGAELSRILLHEYVHLVLHHTTGPLPKWLEEGLAEFYSTLELASGKLRLGRPIEHHVALLGKASWMAASDFAAVTSNSPVYDEISRASVFYAQSWALVHCLRLGETFRGVFSAFFQAVAAGEPPGAALQRFFGKSLAELLAEVERYLRQGALPVAEYPLLVETAPAATTLTPLSDIEGELAFAELAYACRRPEAAQRSYQKLSRRVAENPAAISRALALLALADRRTQQAKLHFQNVLETPQVPADVHFEYAMLLRDEGASREQYLPHLRQAVTLDPNYAEAHFLLGVDYQQNGQHALAIPHLEHAASVFPRQSYFWHALAVSYMALGKVSDSRAAARRALDSALTAEQAEMARAALQLSPPSPRPERKKVDVILPDSWRKNEGEAEVSGILERIDCLGEPARFLIRTGNQTIALLVEKPGEILLKNLSSTTFEFRCGPQKPTPVRIEYRRRPDAKLGVAGIITAIEFP
ncbi:MAG: hypothetical protein NZV14_14745 [Bryobacteraceae bacterium]|nr:hypothetical protein [Bryobacteraceae bacterium]MDW8379421.1 hypothetical protein [Bryobacterales bacterium]